MKQLVVGGLVLLALALVSQTVLAQTEAETQARVPELEKLHEVIYPMWHVAYPHQDTAKLRELWPDIQKGVAAVEKAELPGILRDKKDAWQKGLENLKATEKAYGEALDKGTATDKLKAAEQLHWSYEVLMRTIRPMLKEMNAFHEALYKIYHYYLPNKDQKSLKEILPTLKAKMDTLDRATLPEYLAPKQEGFTKARAELSKKVKRVVTVAPKGNWTWTQKAIEEMHAAYQALEKTFD
jgi:hypothetical protein